MLRITVQNGNGSPKVRLDGKLSGEWVGEFEKVCDSLSHGDHSSNMTLDLSGVTYVDSEGKRVLSELLGRGATFQEPQLLVKYIVDEIRAGR
jgi:anti-anti-sigma regulatory factor